MQISKQALKEWRQVRSQEEMMEWHKTYTPWLTQSQIILLDGYYRKQIEDLEAQREKEEQEAMVNKLLQEDQNQDEIHQSSRLPTLLALPRSNENKDTSEFLKILPKCI